MNRQENIKKMYEQAKLDTANEKDKAVLEKLKEIYLQESNVESKTIELSLWRKFMLSKLKYKVAAILCFVILVSAAAAVTIPGIYKTIRTFITAIDEKDINELIILSDPMSALPHQMDDINQIMTESKIELVSLYTDINHAIAVTTEVLVEDSALHEGLEKGPLVITLERKENQWLVTDIDFENDKTVLEEINRFLNEHPNAVEIIPK